MSRLWLLLTIAFLCLVPGRSAFAGAEPFMVETRVQSDLETVLGRLVAPEEFLVMVAGEVTTRTERKLVESDMIVGESEDETVTPPPPMPGFVPEPTDLTDRKKKPLQSRQTYRMVETPVLTALRVRVNFDDQLAPATITRAKDLVTAYLKSNYPDRASAVFAQMPMRKPEKAKDAVLALPPPEKKAEEVKKEDKPDTLSWSILAGLGIVIFLLLQRMLTPQKSQNAAPNYAPSPTAGIAEILAAAGIGGRGTAREMGSAGSATVSTGRRKKTLEKFMARSEAFKLFYDRASNEAREELYAALKGPAYDSLLEGLGYKRPMESDLDAQSLEEKLTLQEKNFEEFVQAKDWQERQFFGFVHQLTDEQVLALINYQDPEVVGTLVRFMKPQQSALVLDALPQIRRREILGYAQAASTKPLSELLRVEKTLRETAQRIPAHALGNVKEEPDFWGSVLSESQHQDELYDDFEVTSPGIAPQLKKFKFKLEDAASLPDKMLGSVLGRVDNEELCLALATCTPDVAEVILDAVAPNRRDTLKKQMVSYKGARKDQAVAARAALTKRFREVLT